MFAITPRFRRSRRSARGRPSAWPFARCLPRPDRSVWLCPSRARSGGVDSDAARTNTKFHFRYLLALFGTFRSSPREPAAPEKLVRNGQEAVKFYVSGQALTKVGQSDGQVFKSRGRPMG